MAQDNVKAASTEAGSADPATAEEQPKKYSRGLKEPQKLEASFSRAAARLARAVADGVDEYRSGSDKSARKKRDGAIRDAVRNLGRGLEEALTTGAKVPTDLTKDVSLRRLARLIVPPPFSGFLR